jgi:hypothetical protein
MSSSPYERIKKEVDDLVHLGLQISETASTASDNLGQDWIVKTSAWVNRIGSVLQKLYGSGSIQMSSYNGLLETENFYVLHSNYYRHVSAMQGIISAVQHDLGHGLLTDLRGLVQADIFADFIEMAEYLLSEGYKDAAAVIIGGCSRTPSGSWRRRMMCRSPGPTGRPSLLSLSTSSAGRLVCTTIWCRSRSQRGVTCVTKQLTANTTNTVPIR